MAADEDDWVGEPPEGRISRDRSRPGFWADQWQARLATALLGITVLVAVALVLILG